MWRMGRLFEVKGNERCWKGLNRGLRWGRGSVNAVCNII